MNDQRVPNDNAKQKIQVSLAHSEKLLTIPVVVEGQKYAALIDSGGSCSFIVKSIVEEFKLEVDKSNILTISGHGGSKTSTIGTVHINLNFCGEEILTKVEVMIKFQIK